MQGRGAKNKGREGEKEFAALLASHGYEAYRDGKQFYMPDGTRIHQDVRHDIPGIHFEVKRREKMDAPAWMAQARAECREGLVPIVAWRGNRQPWRVILDAEDFLTLLAKVKGGPNESSSNREQG